MSENLMLVLIGKAVAPPLVLIAAGFAWFHWRLSIPAIPATLISLGVALLAGIIVIGAGYSFPNMSPLMHSLLLIGGFPLLVYAATLALFVRTTNVSKTAIVVCGLFGLIPLYFVGGYVVINAACGFDIRGC